MREQQAGARREVDRARVFLRIPVVAARTDTAGDARQVRQRAFARIRDHAVGETARSEQFARRPAFERGAALAELGKGRGVAQRATIADRKQRAVRAIERQAFAICRPAEAEPASRRPGTGQHIGDPRAFAARKPCGDEGIGGVQLAVHPQWAARQEHRDGRHACGAEFAEQREAFLVAESEVLPVAGEFGIGFLAEDDDRDIGLRRIAAIGGQRGATAAGFEGGFDSGPDRGRAGKLVVGQLGPALPGQRPAACGLRDAVGGASRDQHIRPGRERQHAVILEQHLGLGHRFARDGAVGGCPDRIELPAERAL